MNKLTAVEYPEDQSLRARIRAYELAFRMQAAVPEAIDLAQKTEATSKLYGLDNDATKAVLVLHLRCSRLVHSRASCEHAQRGID